MTNTHASGSRRFNRTLTSLLAASLPLLLSACSEDEQIIEEPDRLVTIIEVGPSNQLGDREFPAVLEASKRANLSFRVNGTLSQLPMKEGDVVKKGQLVAQLSTADAANELADKKAAFKRSAADYKRAESLLKTDYISQKDYDQIKARYQADDAALQQAERNMAYTRLEAPFDGSIANRFVQNHEEIVQGQTIYSLMNIESFDVKFEVPEQLMLKVSASEEIPPEEKATVQIRFASRPDTNYDMTFKEVATKADPERQTFQVTYTLPYQNDLNLLPGMTGTVMVQLANTREQSFRVPSRVVVGNSKLTPQVWTFDKKTSTVSAVPVTIGTMAGNEIEVFSGIQQGDMLIDEAAALLHEGEKVRIREGSKTVTEEVK